MNDCHSFSKNVFVEVDAPMFPILNYQYPTSEHLKSVNPRINQSVNFNWSIHQLIIPF